MFWTSSRPEVPVYSPDRDSCLARDQAPTWAVGACSIWHHATAWHTPLFTTRASLRRSKNLTRRSIILLLGKCSTCTLRQGPRHISCTAGYDSSSYSLKNGVRLKRPLPSLVICLRGCLPAWPQTTSAWIRLNFGAIALSLPPGAMCVARRAI